ncbi:MAG TPA: hypothetical protein VHB21_13775 [Minicystis sp.]|nr:hypothetical protein [Minicystis sp.]
MSPVDGRDSSAVAPWDGDAAAFFAVRLEFADADAAGDEAKRAFFAKHGLADEAAWRAVEADALRRLAAQPATMAAALATAARVRVAEHVARASAALPDVPPELAAPVDGVDLAAYARASVALEGAVTNPARSAALAAAGVDEERRWRAIDAAWQKRMSDGTPQSSALRARFQLLATAARMREPLR